MRWPGGFDGHDRSFMTGKLREVATITIPVPTGARYFVGLDLGQAQDYTALVVVEQQDTSPTASYQARHLERFALGTAYPAIGGATTTPHPDPSHWAKAHGQR